MTHPPTYKALEIRKIASVKQRNATNVSIAVADKTRSIYTQILSQKIVQNGSQQGAVEGDYRENKGRINEHKYIQQ